MSYLSKHVLIIFYQNIFRTYSEKQHTGASDSKFPLNNRFYIIAKVHVGVRFLPKTITLVSFEV